MNSTTVREATGAAGEPPSVAGKLKSTMLAGLLAGIGGLVAGCGTTVEQAQPGRSDVPMSRPEECLAVHDGIGGNGAFLQLPDGRILHQTRRRFHVSTDGGITWAESWTPRYADSTKAMDWGDGSLVILKDGTLAFVGRLVPPPPPGLPPRPPATASQKEKDAWEKIAKNPGRDDWRVAMWRSRDGGKTWSQSARLTPRTQFGQNCLSNVLVRASSGRLIVPVYVAAADEPTMGDRCYVCYSDDEGATWKKSQPMNFWVEHDGRRIPANSWEPSIVEVQPGRFLALMRTRMGRMYQSWSFNNGETWTDAAPTELAASPAPAALAKIPGTDDLLVIWNQVNITESRRGFWRARLSTAVSRDEGRTWTHFQNIESSIEGTRIAPDPIEAQWVVEDINPGRAEKLSGYVNLSPDPDKRRKGRLYGSYTYPSVQFHDDRLLVGHADLHFGANQEVVSIGRVRVVPVSWLYGGTRAIRNAAGPE